MDEPVSRRRFGALLAVGAAVVTAGCGDTEGPGDPADPDPPGEDAVGEEGEGDAGGPGNNDSE